MPLHQAEAISTSLHPSYRLVQAKFPSGTGSLVSLELGLSEDAGIAGFRKGGILEPVREQPPEDPWSTGGKEYHIHPFWGHPTEKWPISLQPSSVVSSRL